MYNITHNALRNVSHRDAADLVVQGKGKYEELMVCSHEIAASTAQLVAASKVRRYFLCCQSIKYIYKALFTSADITKCCTETQPKTPNSK